MLKLPIPILVRGDATHRLASEMVRLPCPIADLDPDTFLTCGSDAPPGGSCRPRSALSARPHF